MTLHVIFFVQFTVLYENFVNIKNIILNSTLAFYISCLVLNLFEDFKVSVSYECSVITSAPY